MAQQKIFCKEHISLALAIHGQEYRYHFSLRYSSCVVPYLIIFATVMETYCQGSNSTFQKYKTVMGV